MTETEDRAHRLQCKREDCGKIRKALRLLDRIANSPASMGYDDIERLSEARELLGAVLGLTYNEETSRYEAAE